MFLDVRLYIYAWSANYFTNRNKHDNPPQEKFSYFNIKINLFQ